MQHLTEGYKKFKSGLNDEDMELYRSLEEGQQPKVLLITCSDSRVVPNLFTSMGPDKLFTFRNIGNILPEASTKEMSIPALLEFAIKAVKVEHIIVCGHSSCAAMHGLMTGVQELPHVQAWLDFAKKTLTREKINFEEGLSDLNQTSQLNVLQQLDSLMTHETVRIAVEQKSIQLHGWWFFIKTASLLAFDQHENRFKELG